MKTVRLQKCEKVYSTADVIVEDNTTEDQLIDLGYTLPKFSWYIHETTTDWIEIEK